MSPLQKFIIRYSKAATLLLLLCWFVFGIGVLVRAWKPGAFWIAALTLALLLSSCVYVWGRWMRERFIREGPLPQFIKRKLREQYSELSDKDMQLIERGLRQFFLACARSGRKTVGMPSVVVSHAWRAFAGQAAPYENWCSTALGSVLPPTPAARLGADVAQNDALRRTWYWACKEEAIKPDDPSRLPILFALDAKLAINGGILYFANSLDFARRPADSGEVYFGTSFCSDEYGGSCSDFGGADSGGDGGGDGGGD